MMATPPARPSTSTSKINNAGPKAIMTAIAQTTLQLTRAACPIEDLRVLSDRGIVRLPSA
jgi:hypothetical protein